MTLAEFLRSKDRAKSLMDYLSDRGRPTRRNTLYCVAEARRRGDGSTFHASPELAALIEAGTKLAGSTVLAETLRPDITYVRRRGKIIAYERNERIVLP